MSIRNIFLGTAMALSVVGSSVYVTIQTGKKAEREISIPIQKYCNGEGKLTTEGAYGFIAEVTGNQDLQQLTPEQIKRAQYISSGIRIARPADYQVYQDALKTLLPKKS